jgi:nucleotide-binding universal stress UspA family protein
MTTRRFQHSLNILLADDGSQHSQAAIRLLCDLPVPAETKIFAITVFTPLQSSDHARFRQTLETTRACLANKGLNVSSELQLGYPAEKIIEYAENLHPDLIILGAKGLRATLGILLGGVAQQVVEYANWPVLVVRAPYKPIERILFATDGSEYSQKALEYLVDFPFPQPAEVHLIHIMPPAPEPYPMIQAWPPAPEVIQPAPFLSPEEIDAMLQEQSKRGAELLERTRGVLEASGKTVYSELVRGDAATEIIRYIKEKGVDLVVVGSRGLSQVKSWLLGSVSRKIIHYSDCSVLIVKSGDHRQM